MKKGIAIFTAIILFVLLCPYCFSACTITDDVTTVSVNIPDSASIITPENLSSQSELVSKLNKSESDIQKLFDSGYIFFALTSDQKYTISLCREQTEISKSAVNLSSFNEEVRNKIINNLCGGIISNADSAEEISKDGANFYKIVYRNPEDNLPSIYYITVLNGYCVTLRLDSMVSNIDSNGFSVIQNIFDNMQFTVLEQQAKSDAKAYDVMKWIIACSIIVLLGVIVIVLIILIKSIRKEKEAGQWRSKIRRKPRR